MLHNTNMLHNADKTIQHDNDKTLCNLKTESTTESKISPSLPSLLLLDRKGDKSLHSKSPAQRSAKPNICKLPDSDVRNRMKAFMPFLAKNNSSVDAPPCDSAVQFIPISDSESDSETDSETDSDSGSSYPQAEGPCVEMRLALVPDTTSDSEDDNSTDYASASIGEVTADNIKLPGSDNIRPAIEELN